MEIKNMTEKGGYIIDVNNIKKLMNIDVKGVFTPEQAVQFHTDYQKQVNSISAKDYTLDIDCTDMQVIKQDMIPLLTKSYELYKTSGFGKIEFKIIKNPIIKMQLNRIAKNIDLPNYEIIEL
ncbi:hypothetical protein ACQKP0_24610 [Heyndrickxia sp. NPDC080065]|uniref:hypothetical protein n=1 Tax=Heyndrickxia sp. NPDC080065 TaxID=3390568 RepID=UPI003D0957E7